MVAQYEHLSAELTRFRELRHRLLRPCADMDEATAHDALDGLTKLHDAIIGTVRSALEDEDAASRLRGKMDAMEAELRRIERRAQGKRDMALAAMAEAGLEHLEAAGVRIRVRRAPPLLVVSDEDLVPEAFRIERRAPFDYQRIREALETGADVPGVQLAAPEPYLSVRAG